MRTENAVHFNFLEEALKTFDPSLVNKAQRLTVSALKGKVKTQISKTAREKYNVSASKLGQALNMRIDDSQGLRSATLEYVGSRIGLINFSGKFKNVRTTGKSGHLAGVQIRRRGATAKVIKGQSPQLIGRAFIANGANGAHIFRRINKNDPNSKIQRVTGPSIPQIVSQRKVFSDGEKVLQTEFPRVFESKLTFLAGKANK